MKRIALLMFVLIVVGVVNTAEPNVQAISFVTLSGRALGFDSQPIVNAKVFSDEADAVNRVLTCTKADGSWSLEVPVNSASRTMYIWLSPKLTGNNNIDCDAATSGSIPSLGCWTEVGPFVATSDRTINFDVAAMQSRTLRIVDGDGFPFYGARIGSPNGGQSGPCPVSSPQIVAKRSFMNESGDGDTNMDGLISVVGPTPFGKDINIFMNSGYTSVAVNLSSLDQRVELPVRQSLPGAPTVTVSQSEGNPLISVSANSRDVGLSKFTVKLSDGSLVCTIALQSNETEGFCFMTEWTRSQTYDFVISSWNGKGEGSGTSVKHTMPGWNTTSTSAPVPSTTPTATPTTIASTPSVTTPTATPTTIASTPSVTTPAATPTTIASTPTVTTPTANTSMTRIDTVYTSTGPTPKVLVTKTIAAKSIASFAKLVVLSTSKVSVRVVSAYAKYCKVSGSTVKGLKTGSCKVTVTVTPKKGKATSKTVTLKVTK